MQLTEKQVLNYINSFFQGTNNLLVAIEDEDALLWFKNRVMAMSDAYDEEVHIVDAEYGVKQLLTYCEKGTYPCKIVLHGFLQHTNPREMDTLENLIASMISGEVFQYHGYGDEYQFKGNLIITEPEKPRFPSSWVYPESSVLVL